MILDIESVKIWSAAAVISLLEDFEYDEIEVATLLRLITNIKRYQNQKANSIYKYTNNLVYVSFLEDNLGYVSPNSRFMCRAHILNH